MRPVAAAHRAARRGDPCPPGARQILSTAGPWAGLNQTKSRLFNGRKNKSNQKGHVIRISLHGYGVASEHGVRRGTMKNETQNGCWARNGKLRRVLSDQIRLDPS